MSGAGRILQIRHPPMLPAEHPVPTVSRGWRWSHQRGRSALIATAAAVAILVALAATAWATEHMSYTLWGAMWIGPVLMLASLPIANRAARLDGDVLIGRVILVSAFIRIFVAPPLRYWMAYGLYGGSSDSAVYHRAGAMLASQLRHGDYSNLGHISGDRFIQILTGQVYAFTGVTRFGGFMVFSWMSLVGVYFFYRAFRIAYPDGHYRRYAKLVFFWPSLIFWPAALGKEAFMILVLGAAALGAAELFTGRFQGIIWLGLGVWGAAVVRVHMVLIFGAGLIVAAVLAVLTGGPHGRKPVFSRLASASLIVSLVLVSPTIIGVAEHTFGVAKLTPQSAQQILDQTTLRSGKNGSTFTAPSPNNPVGFAVATGTVLFRPFPIEVSNAQAVATGFEGLILMGICILSARRFRRLPVELVRRPYVAFSFVYTLAFIYAFSSLSNFGILARERVQVLPMLFVLLCVPVDKRITSKNPDQMRNVETHTADAPPVGSRRAPSGNLR